MTVVFYHNIGLSKRNGHSARSARASIEQHKYTRIIRPRTKHYGPKAAGEPLWERIKTNEHRYANELHAMPRHYCTQINIHTRYATF